MIYISTLCSSKWKNSFIFPNSSWISALGLVVSEGGVKGRSSLARTENMLIFQLRRNTEFQFW